MLNVIISFFKNLFKDKICFGCKGPIKQRQYLAAGNKRWHDWGCLFGTFKINTNKDIKFLGE
jgi:hypothetical protein